MCLENIQHYFNEKLRKKGEYFLRQGLGLSMKNNIKDIEEGLGFYGVDQQMLKMYKII